MRQGPPEGGPCTELYVRRRPTLPPPLGGSTIGAGRLNFRVRDGSGWFPVAMAAVTLVTQVGPRLCWGRGVGGVVAGVSSCGYRLVVWCWVVDANMLFFARFHTQ